jgi:hypothetical protein
MLQEMIQDKVTKNTIRYSAIEEDSSVPTVYIKKSGLPNPAPEIIMLNVIWKKE